MPTTLSIAGMVVLTVVFLILVALVIWLCLRASHRGDAFRADIRVASLFRFSVSTTSNREGESPAEQHDRQDLL
jgi:hypothetical protein